MKKLSLFFLMMMLCVSAPSYASIYIGGAEKSKGEQSSDRRSKKEIDYLKVLNMLMLKGFQKERVLDQAEQDELNYLQCELKECGYSKV